MIALWLATGLLTAKPPRGGAALRSRWTRQRKARWQEDLEALAHEEALKRLLAKPKPKKAPVVVEDRDELAGQIAERALRQLQLRMELENINRADVANAIARQIWQIQQEQRAYDDAVMLLLL
jgi:hypothetical protein